MSESAALPKLDSTFGVMFLGVVLAFGLWGASSIQTFYYFDQFPKDPWQMKLLVTVVYLLDTAHQGLITHSVYKYLITNFFNPVHLGLIEDSLRDMVMLNFVIICTVQSFFLYRVFRLSHRNYLLVGVLAVLSAGQFTSIVVYFAKVYPMKTLAELSTLITLEKVCNILGAVSDLSIAASLVFLLRNSRSQSRFKQTQTLVNRMIMFSIKTGLITSFCAIMAFVSVLAWPETFMYIAFYLLISRLYANSLLATLNARTSLAGSGAASSNEDSQMAVNSFQLSRMRAGEGKGAYSSKGAVSVKIDTETHHDDESNFFVKSLPQA
ncbi:hypothetical protein SCHPADRAFT_139964 [Schizopora paradoxa]|uniref:DUF6534 domain-containing protein n=1 Tax=Schizopora paradoxa TaxID=27342 RepID=A0A0H2S0V2_9AGAM|nr:hypothetical protein SCHPADRAFT_139964 [Schizopora paradoxa]